MPDGNPNPNPDPKPDPKPGVPPGGNADDIAYWQGEAKKAFQARDAIKAQMRDLEGRALSEDQKAEYDRLKGAAAKLEEDRKRAEGQFDALKAELVSKHDAELKAAQQQLADLKQTVETRDITTAFLGASEWFGPTGKTILPPEVAMAYLRPYCAVDDGRVVVRDLKGQVIHGRDGNPAPFAEAMGELIGSLPHKDALLRGSGKVGSGSAGGSQGVEALDMTALIARARSGDPNALARLRQVQAAEGGIVQGAAFERPAPRG